LKVRLALDGVEVPGLLFENEDEEYPLAREEVSCQWGCGVRYCSLKCAEMDMAEGHALLCVGPLESADHPLLEFKNFAIQHNEIFLLAGKLVAKSILAQAARGGILEGDCLDDYIWPTSLLMREPWSDCVVYSSSLTPEEKESKEFLEYCSDLSPE
jgi:hypothetical protein